jgi:hypothetical protein
MAEVAGSIPVGPTTLFPTLFHSEPSLHTFVRQRTELLRPIAYGGCGFS